MRRLLPALWVLSCALALQAQMVNPAIDRPNEPFSYFAKPTDVIGVMDARMATEITPEGYLYTSSGELMFFTGNPPRPVNARVRTLYKGHLPVVEYQVERDGVLYEFQMLATTMGTDPAALLVNWVRVNVRNAGSTPATAWFGAGVRYTSQTNTGSGTGDNRFNRPAFGSKPGDYYQGGVEFNPDWTYGFQGNAFLRGGKVMYWFPKEPQPELMLTLKTGYNYPQDLKPRKLKVWPDTPVGIALYQLKLAPGQQQQLEFEMPVEPLDPTSSAYATAVTMAMANPVDHGGILQQTARFWDDLLAKGIEINVPEQKVNDTFKANLIYDLIARDKVGDDYVQTVNKFHYHMFWLRDSSYIIRMYDLSGYHDIARQCLEFYARWQQPDGNFVSQGGQFDGWGQALWAYGQHYRITHDREFGEKIFPAVVKAVQWLKQSRAADPLHVMPSTSPGDNEDITGHVTGHNFWALAGLKNAIALADGLGHKQEAADFRREYADFFKAFVAALNQVTQKTGGYMPPGLEGPGGQDWGNMLAVYPEIILDPHDPMVTATLERTRAKYQEGIMTYGDGRFVHHYLTMKNTETETVRGDQEMAVGELYALLVHTSSTHAGFEYSILPWGPRDFDGNLAPHGWFAAKFRAALRNMLVREQGNELHLLSVISPEWVKDGQKITVHRAPTNLGQVNFDLEFAPGRATLSLDNHFSEQPQSIVLHLPWFMDVNRVMADGKEAAVRNGAVTMPITARSIEITWTKKAGVPALSYAKAVSDYKAEYARRYQNSCGQDRDNWLRASGLWAPGSGRPVARHAHAGVLAIRDADF